MPHIIVEYTDNIQGEARIKELLKKINNILITEGDAFPIGGIRSRAMALHDYCIADGAGADDAFVHVTLKIGGGRSEELKKHVCDRLFKLVEDHFSTLFERRYIALSMELHEFSSFGTYKKNNIHQRYRK